MRLNEILASLLSLSFSLACPARYDKAANWVNRRVSTAQEFYNDMLPWQAAGALNTVFSIAGGIANTPQGLGHFGEGTGTFSADPTLLNAAGMFGDISLAAGAAAGTAGWARVGVTAVEETGAAMRYSRAGGASGDFMIPGEGALQAGLQDPALYGTRLTTTPTFNPALAEDASEVRLLVCPNCAGQLKVGFHRGQRIMSAKVECKKCDYVVRMDGLASEPPWVSELGTDFETAP